jgi:hypothetical protein
MFSNSTRASPQVPGAFPASSVDGEPAPCENEATENEEGSDSDESSDIEEMTQARTTGIREEPLPGAPVYNRRLQDGLKEVKRELAVLAETMGLSELNQNHFSDLHALYEQTKRMSMFEYPDTRTVGFIGDSGVGMV